MTALVLPGFHLHSVPARANHWEIEKHKWQEPVLLSKPWLDMGFAKTQRELDRYADEGVATMASIRAWLDSLGGLIGACYEKLLLEAARIELESGPEGFAVSAESHPQKALLYLARRGNLDLETVQKRCPTPRKTLEMAGQLGLFPTIPAPVQR